MPLKADIQLSLEEAERDLQDAIRRRQDLRQHLDSIPEEARAIGQMIDTANQFLKDYPSHSTSGTKRVQERSLHRVLLFVAEHFGYPISQAVPEIQDTYSGPPEMSSFWASQDEFDEAVAKASASSTKIVHIHT